MTAVCAGWVMCTRSPRLVPGKADREAQTQFLETYDHIRNLQGQDNPIYFMDATHPQHHPVFAGGWIKRGEEQGIPTNTGRRRVNINGAIDLERLEPVVCCDDTINADSTIALFEQLVAFHPMAVCIYVICDNVPYYRSKVAQDYLKASRIQLVFLPPYAPNLNLIERLWRFFKKRVLYSIIGIMKHLSNFEQRMKHFSRTRANTNRSCVHC